MTIDAQEIRHNYKRWPNANCGIATGKISGIWVSR
jgi:hypothetical protein